MTRRTPIVTAALAIALVAAGCGGSSSGGGKTSGAKVTVFAAASLTDAFGTIGKGYDATNNSHTTFSSSVPAVPAFAPRSKRQLRASR